MREQLAFLPAPSDAVGRTSSIAGGITVTGAPDALTVSSASFTVDVSTLTSDRQMRDQRLHVMGLESDRYPKATFVLTQPVAWPAAFSSGAAVTVPATGDLAIHGTTQTVTIPLQARLSGTSVEVVGSTSFPFGRFKMTPPSIAGFVNVQDTVTMEFDLHLQHA